MRVRQQAVVAELGQLALSGPTLETLMDAAVGAVAEALEVEYVKVLELLPGGNRLLLRSGIGWRNGLVGRATVEARDRSQAGYTLQSNEPVIVSDLLRETRFHGPNLLLDHGVVSGLSVIIRGLERPYGILGAHTTHRRAFSQDDIHFLQSIANLLAAAIERIRAEDTIREDELRLQMAMEAGRLGTWEWDVRSNTVIWSRSLEVVHGLEPGTFGGTFEAYFADIYPDDREIVSASLKQTLESGAEHDLEYRIVWPDGTVRWLHARGRMDRDPAGTLLRMRGVCMDITDRKQAEQAMRLLAEAGEVLAESLEFETTLARVAALAVPSLGDWCAVDLLAPDGHTERVAVAHVDHTKVALAKAVERAYPPDPQSPYGIHAVLRTGKPKLYPVVDDDLLARAAHDETHARLLRRLGVRSAMIVPLIAGGRTLGAISFVSAESGRRYGTSDLSLAQALASRAAQAVENARLYREAQDAIKTRDEFLYSISHDLKNPLSAVKGYAQLLRARVDKLVFEEAPKVVEGLKAIDAAATRMVGQIEELLDLARLQMGKPLELRRFPTDLVALAAAAVEEYAQTAPQHAVTLVTELNSLAGEWDPTRLQRVLGNLLANAIKYSPNGGEVTVRLAEEADSSQRWAVLSVADRGIGIPAADLPHVFERYRRAENVGTIGGSGIGLSSVRQIVEQHGGSVRVESREGEGATFTVRLPLALSQESVPASPVHPDVRSLAPDGRSQSV